MTINNLDQYIAVHKSLYKHLNFDGSGIDVILKGHLLIEEVLNKILERTVVSTAPIKQANLSFYKTACVVKALHEHECKEWVWDSIFSLNSIRNKLAHQLEINNIDDLIEDFTLFVKTHGDGTKEFGDELGFYEEPMAIVNIHSELWRLLDKTKA